MTDTITCIRCGREVERTAQEGQELQPSPDFVCDDCANPKQPPQETATESL